MERSFHTLLAAANGGNFDVAITRPGATIIPDSDYSIVVFHVNLIKLLSRIDVELVQKLRWRFGISSRVFFNLLYRETAYNAIVNRYMNCTHMADLRAIREMSPGQVLSAPFGTCEIVQLRPRKRPKDAKLGEPDCASCHFKNAPTGKFWRDTT